MLHWVFHTFLHISFRESSTTVPGQVPSNSRTQHCLRHRSSWWLLQHWSFLECKLAGFRKAQRQQLKTWPCEWFSVVLLCYCDDRLCGLSSSQTQHRKTIHCLSWGDRDRDLCCIPGKLELEHFRTPTRKSTMEHHSKSGCLLVRSRQLKLLHTG